MRVLFVSLVAFVMAGCASGYQTFYKPYVDARTLGNVELLEPGEEPKVYGTKNFDRDIKILKSKMYRPIGDSSFNGEYEDVSNVKAQAKRIGATLVLVNSEYTNTQTTTTHLFVPNPSTTYHSGSVYGSGGYGGYSGTSTTYGSTAVPITTHQRRYDQTAVFFVKSTEKLRFGIFLNNISNEQRIALERNTGAIIDVVVEESPAFYSNVLPGDILIKVNDSDVRNRDHAMDLLDKVSLSANSALFTIIRKGTERAITIKLDKN